MPLSFNKLRKKQRMTEQRIAKPNIEGEELKSLSKNNIVGQRGTDTTPIDARGDMFERGGVQHTAPPLSVCLGVKLTADVVA
jgi:hypothetical protein